MLRLLILTAKNAPLNITSTHSTIQTLSHIYFARYEWFGRTGTGMNLHQRCLRVQSIWDTVGIDPGRASTISDCSKHYIQGHEQLTWEQPDCREYIQDFLPDLNLIYNWGKSRRVVTFHNIWQKSARKHRSCQEENKNLMIEDRRRKSSVGQEILLWSISMSLPAF